MLRQCDILNGDYFNSAPIHRHQASSLAPTPRLRRPPLDMRTIPMFQIPGRAPSPEPGQGIDNVKQACPLPSVDEPSTSNNSSHASQELKGRTMTRNEMREASQQGIAASHSDQIMDWREMLHRAREETRLETQKQHGSNILMDGFK